MGQGPAVVPTHKTNPQMLERWWSCCEVHTCSAQWYPVLSSFFCLVCSRSLRQGHFYFAVSIGFALVNTYIWAQPLASQRFTDKMPPPWNNNKFFYPHMMKELRMISCPFFVLDSYIRITDFPCSSVSKESACNAGDLGSIPGSGRSPREGNGNPLQHSCLENPQGQRSLAGYNPWGHKSWTQLSN